MLCKKQLCIIVAIILSTGADFTPMVSLHEKSGSLTAQLQQHPLVRRIRKVDPMKLNKDLVKNTDFAKLFRSLHRNLSPDEVRMVTTLGLLSGALRVEESMRENLFKLSDDLVGSFNVTTPKENMKKLVKIEQTINRDKSVVRVLNGMLKYARNETTLELLQKDMIGILKESDATAKQLHKKKTTIDKEIDVNNRRQSVSTGKLMDTTSGLKRHINQRLYDVRETIDNHIEQIHSSVMDNVKLTMKYIQKMQKNSKKTAKRRNSSRKPILMDPTMVAMGRIWEQVASSEESEERDIGVTIKYQPVSQITKINQVKQIVPMAKKEQMVANGENKPRLTKGEEEELLAILAKSRLLQTLPSVSTSTTESPAIMKLILVDTKVERFKRQNANDKMDTAFSVSVDMDHSNGNVDSKVTNRKDEEDDKENEIEGVGDTDHMKESQEEDGSVEVHEGGGGDGLVGLIANLSGGEEGSDVGAVLGALSQVVSNILGPGGIDVVGLAGTGATLIASLIGGEENFGKVLGTIGGLAIDGFSGGGGAANNGQFFGQFIGKFVASLSADPEDEDAPLQPNVFVENLWDGLAKGSAPEMEGEQENKEDDEKDDKHKSIGSDSSSFLKSLIGGIVRVATSASATASASSSHHSAAGSTQAVGKFSSAISGHSSKKDDDHKEGEEKK